MIYMIVWVLVINNDMLIYVCMFIYCFFLSGCYFDLYLSIDYVVLNFINDFNIIIKFKYFFGW